MRIHYLPFSMQQVLLALLVFSEFDLVKGSAGDMSYAYHRCTTECILSCNAGSKPHLPMYLRLLSWTCPENCGYECMQNITEDRVKAGQNILQYRGKWPFIRVFGIQEPASVFFSFLNLMGHILGMTRLRQVKLIEEYPFYGLCMVYFGVSINAWLCSMIFHSRDLPWTEKMDYFSASLVIMVSAFLSVTRIVGKVRDVRSGISGVCLLCLFTYHLYYMNFVNFDYGYNIKFNVVIGFFNLFSWLLWCYMKRIERPYVWKCAAVLTTICFSVGLEVFDFPPFYGVFDAHSVWHLVTAPLCYYWYSFLVDDAHFEILRIRESKID